MLRKLLVVVAVVALALVLWSVFRGDTEGDRPVAAGPGAAATAAERSAGEPVTEPATEPARALPEQRAPAAARAAVDPVADPAEGSPRAEAAAEELLTGRVVVLVDAARIEGLSGRLTLTRFAGIAGRQVEVDVVDGRFELPAPAAGDHVALDFGDAPEVSLDVAHGTLGAYRVIAADRTPRAGATPPGADGTWVLEAVPAFDQAFTVVAAEDGTLLADGVVRRLANGWELDGGSFHPEGRLGGRLAGPGPSPLTVPFERLVGWQWMRVGVGAPDRVWRSVPVDPTRGTPQVVELERAGALRVTLVDFRPESSGELELSVRRQGRRPFFAQTVSAVDPVTVGDLPPGPWRITLSRGAEWQAVVFAEAQVEVVAGETVPVTLRVDPTAGELEAAFATELVLELPEAWGATVLRWRTERQAPRDGRVHARQGDSRGELADGLVRHALDLGELPIGDYGLSLGLRAGSSGEAFGLAGSGIVAPFRVDGTGRSRVVLEPPVELVVRVTDETGEPAGEQVQWIGRVAGVQEPTQLFLAETAPGVWTAAAQAGPGQLLVSARDGGFEVRKEELLPGAPPFEVVLVRNATVELRLRCDGAPLDLSPEVGMPALERVDGSAASTSYMLLPSGITAHLRPGRYRVGPQAIEGYLAPEPFEFEATLEDTAVVELEYRRDGR